MTVVRKCGYRGIWIGLMLCAWLAAACPDHAAGAAEVAADDGRSARPAAGEHLSLADHRFAWPTWEHWVRVVTMRDYNTRIVLLGTFLLGLCGGGVGVFLLLRKRALVGDVIAHSALPGIGIAFIAGEMIQPGSGKSLPILLAGALIAGMLGALATTAIHRYTRIKEDAALAIVLSIFFGVGVALFTIIQNIPTGNAAGLHHFIFGKAASMIADDVKLIAAAAVAVLLACGLLFKEFALLSFDEKYAAAQGWPTTVLDLALMGLVVGVTVIGLESVGLLLVVAMLIIPAAAARFWTDRLGRMVLVSAALGGVSALLGTMASALFPRLAAGAIIVLAGSCFFVLSLLLGTRRGVLRRIATHWRLRRRTGRDHLLRAIYEYLESAARGGSRLHSADMTAYPIPFDRLLAMRSWTPRELQKLLAAAGRENLVHLDSDGSCRLTPEGAVQARRVARNHRLWELYLIRYADIAPSHVDRDADQIEHILEPALIEELEELLSAQYPHMVVPPSPHALEAYAGAK